MTTLTAFAASSPLLDELWSAWTPLDSNLKRGLASLLGLLCLLVLYRVIRRIALVARPGLKRWLTALSCTFLVLALGLGTWAYLLPEPQRVSFVLSHQIIRVCAALSGTVTVILLMSLALPWALDLLERRGFVSFVAARHVRATKTGFLTVISILSISGVGISSLALCAVVSIMGGFGADLKTKILGNNAHISIDMAGARPSAAGTDDAASEPAAPSTNWDDILDQIRLVPGVAAATPVVTGEAMASSRSNTAGVLIRGIEVGSIGSVIDLVRNIEVGRFEYLSQPSRIMDMAEDEAIWIGRGGHRYPKGPRSRARTKPDDTAEELDPEVAEVIRREDTYPGVVLGRELAKTLHVYVGDEITLVSPIGDLGPMGVLPRARKFRVAAVFYSGMYEYDSSQAYMTLEAAQQFLDQQGNISQFDVRVDNEQKANLVRDALVAKLDGEGLRIRDWMEMNKGLFSALELEKIVTFIILSIAIVVGSFCIICTLLLMVTEKSKEIAILKATGASDGSILKIFMTEGLLIGGIGTVFGVVTGLVLCLALLWFGVRLDPDVYYVDRLPINVDPLDYSLVALCSMAITVAATVYPALAASRLRPVEGIRYE
jgi:lipoprotein-releasing system permease protein